MNLPFNIPIALRKIKSFLLISIENANYVMHPVCQGPHYITFRLDLECVLTVPCKLRRYAGLMKLHSADGPRRVCRSRRR